MTKYIQFLAPPCSGKSTIAHSLVTYFSLQGIHTEYLPEYAKSLIYKGTLNCFAVLYWSAFHLIGKTESLQADILGKLG